MIWSDEELKEYTIQIVKSSTSRQEVTAALSAHTGVAVSYSALRGAWRRWREQDGELPPLRDLLGTQSSDYNEDVESVLFNAGVREIAEEEDRQILKDLASYPPVLKKPIFPNPRANPPDPTWSDMPFRKGAIYSVIVLPDMQVPYEDKVTMKAVEAYMATKRWDEYINLGDFVDLDCISSHNKVNLRAVEGKVVSKDYKAANVILDRHQNIVRSNNPDARFVLLEGNHEYRAERYIDEHPQMRGLMEVEVGLKLEERGFKYVRCYQKGELYKLGKAYFHHGLYCNQSHAKSMVDRFGVNIFYGHVHDVMCHPKVMWGKDKTIVGQSMGCLCDYEQGYIKQNPTNWQQAFGEFHFFDNGDFSYYVTRVIDNRFISPDGVIFDGRLM
jgi:hypothetical protein